MMGEDYLVEGVSIKNLILAIEIAIQKSSSKVVEYSHFLHSIQSIISP